MNYSIVLPESLNDKLKNHLIRKDHQEDLCFALYSLSTGNLRVSGIINEVILPEDLDRNVHGNVSFNPQFFDKVTQRALKEKKGIVFIHSHPGKGWQSMSKDDINTENMLAPRVKAVTNLPLIGMTIGADGTWCGRFWNKSKPKTYNCDWCESVRVVGRKLSFSINEKLSDTSIFKEVFERTLSAWGETQQLKISKLKVGIVGVGSVGSQLAESLLRTGVQDITLIDFDIIQRKNLDRLHGVKPTDVGHLKTEMYASMLNEYKLYDSQKIKSIPYSIVEQTGFNAAVDCDIIFCCVDRPWPRFILNHLSYACLIPVIDGGIDSSINKNRNNIEQARWRTYTTSPGRRCMKCMGQYKPEDVSLEQSGLLEDQSYIKGLPEDHFSKRGENVYAFSLALAGLQMQQFLSYVLSPKGVIYGAKEMDFVTGNIDFDFQFTCDNDCELTNMIGIGDDVKAFLIQRHNIAEEMRQKSLSIQKIEPKISFLKLIIRSFKTKM